MNGTNFLIPMYMHIFFRSDTRQVSVLQKAKGILIQKTVTYINRLTFCEIKYVDGLAFFKGLVYDWGWFKKNWLDHPGDPLL